MFRNYLNNDAELRYLYLRYLVGPSVCYMKIGLSLYLRYLRYLDTHDNPQANPLVLIPYLPYLTLLCGRYKVGKVVALTLGLGPGLNKHSSGYIRIPQIP